MQGRMLVEERGKSPMFVNVNVPGDDPVFVDNLCVLLKLNQSYQRLGVHLLELRLGFKKVRLLFAVPLPVLM